MRRLARELGVDRLMKATVVVPDDHRLPEQYHGTEWEARHLLNCVGEIMHTSTTSIRFEVCDDETTFAAGRRQRQPGRVRIAESELADGLSLLAVLAQELAYNLLAEKHSVHAVDDTERMATLLPVYFGLGVIGANAALRLATGESWTIFHASPLNASTLGYALALFAWARGERHPKWSRHLRLDARHALKEGLRYLHATGDSVFTPETCGIASRPIAWHALLEQIEDGAPSARIAALWELANRPPTSREDQSEAVRLVRPLLFHKSPEVREEAARVLGMLGQISEPAVDSLLQLLSDAYPDVCSAAALALGRLGLHPATVLPSLAELLDDRDTVRPAALAIAVFGPSARPFVSRLASALTSALVSSEFDDVDCLAYAIECVASDPRVTLNEVLAACDVESRPQAEHALATRHPVAWHVPTRPLSSR